MNNVAWFNVAVAVVQLATWAYQVRIARRCRATLVRRQRSAEHMKAIAASAGELLDGLR